jgi:hypothetical protein
MRKLIPFAVLVAIAGCSGEPPPAPAPVIVARPKPVFPPPTPAPICAKPAEKVAFAVAALRMQLSVIEITCDKRDQFNAFTVKFRNDIAGHNKTVGAFFGRAYGKKGVANQDEYETAQINQMSEAGQYYGADFCKTSGPMLSDVLLLRNGQELADYAVAQGFDQVLAVDECAPPPPKAAAPAKAPVVKRS